jgi:asparagine N-glycosylation enzyme membrane subunit Stt3
LERSLAGFYRGDVFLVFTLLFALYFLLLGVKKNPRFAIPAGFFLFLGGLFWNGWPLAFLVFSLAAALGVLQNYIKGSSSATLVTSFGASSGLALVLLYLFRGSFYRYEPALKETWVLVLGFKLLLLAVLILALTSYLGVKLKDKRGLRLAVVAVIVIALGGAYSLGYVKPVSEYSRLLETTKGTALRETATYVWRTGITEQAKVSLEHLIYMYNILLLLAPLGLIYLFGRGRGAPFVLALVFATFPLLILQVRFIFLAAPALCILAALALPLFARKSLKSTLKRSAASVLLLLLLSLNTLAALTYASTARPFVGEALYDGLLWVSENTPEDAVILAWWDYSGPIVAIADRRSVAHTAPSGIMESFALLLRTSNETQAIEIFKSLNEDSALRDMRADYLIVDTRTYLLWPKILRFEPYVNYHVRVENRELADSMLHRLYVAKNLTRFELVYINTDFRLYRPLFNYTKIASIEASRYYKETPEFVVNVKSNERDRVILRMSISKEDRIVFQAEEEIDANSKYRLLLEEPPAKGRYVFTAELHSPAGVKLHTMSREFIII